MTNFQRFAFLSLPLKETEPLSASELKKKIKSGHALANLAEKTVDLLVRERAHLVKMLKEHNKRKTFTNDMLTQMEETTMNYISLLAGICQPPVREEVGGSDPGGAAGAEQGDALALAALSSSLRSSSIASTAEESIRFIPLFIWTDSGSGQVVASRDVLYELHCQLLNWSLFLLSYAAYQANAQDEVSRLSAYKALQQAAGVLEFVSGQLAPRLQTSIFLKWPPPFPATDSSIESKLSLAPLDLHPAFILGLGRLALGAAAEMTAARAIEKGVTMSLQCAVRQGVAAYYNMAANCWGETPKTKTKSSTDRFLKDKKMTNLLHAFATWKEGRMRGFALLAWGLQCRSTGGELNEQSCREVAGICAKAATFLEKKEKDDCKRVVSAWISNRAFISIGKDEKRGKKPDLKELQQDYADLLSAFEQLQTEVTQELNGVFFSSALDTWPDMPAGQFLAKATVFEEPRPHAHWKGTVLSAFDLKPSSEQQKLAAALEKKQEKSELSKIMAEQCTIQ
mgnify:FL=1|jgi:hypothetical protein